MLNATGPGEAHADTHDEHENRRDGIGVGHELVVVVQLLVEDEIEGALQESVIEFFNPGRLVVAEKIDEEHAEDSIAPKLIERGDTVCGRYSGILGGHGKLLQG